MNRTTEFGKAVKSFRRAKGLTQELLAEKANLHLNSISIVERGVFPPALDTICAIADALDVQVSELALDMEARVIKAVKIRQGANSGPVDVGV